MKWLILLLIVAFAIFLIAMRYRRHIQSALYMWRMFRQIKKASQPKPPAEERKTENRKIDKDASQLVRCARCGKWILQSEALNLRSKTVYCSTTCMEKAARIESLVDKA